MATISEQRAAIAAAVSLASGMTVGTVRPTLGRQGIGWVNLTRVVPSSFSVTACDATYTVVLVLGSDERQAAELSGALAVPVIGGVYAELHPSDVSVEMALIPAGDAVPGDVYAMIVTLTVEVA